MSISPTQRFAVLERDGFLCYYCGSDGPLQVDHIEPLAAGGSDEYSNLITACAPCNRGKSDWVLRPKAKASAVAMAMAAVSPDAPAPRKRGRPALTPGKMPAQVNVRLPQDLADAIDATGRKRSEFLREAAREKLARIDAD